VFLVFKFFFTTALLFSFIFKLFIGGHMSLTFSQYLRIASSPLQINLQWTNVLVFAFYNWLTS
jgi:hypothetical protein